MKAVSAIITPINQPSAPTVGVANVVVVVPGVGVGVVCDGSGGCDWVGVVCNGDCDWAGVVCNGGCDWACVVRMGMVVVDVVVVVVDLVVLGVVVYLFLIMFVSANFSCGIILKYIPIYNN